MLSGISLRYALRFYGFSPCCLMISRRHAFTLRFIFSRFVSPPLSFFTRAAAA